MDEQKNNHTNPQNVPSGFDSVSNIGDNEEKSNFNPTPMFSKMQNEKDSYTVTPEGGFFDNTPQKPTINSDVDKTNKTDLEKSDSNDEETPQPHYSTTVQDTTSSSKQTKTSDFLPNGTYSYSAAKGNLPDSAVNEPLKQPEYAQYYNPNVNNTAAKEQPAHENLFVNKSKKKEEKSSNRKTSKKYGVGVVFVSVILAMVLGLGGGIGGAYYVFKNQSTSNNTTSDVPQKITTINVEESAASITEAVAKKAGPSVIGIRTTAAVTNFFFGTSESTEEGSGIIYSSDGYIITNYHVIESAVESSNSKVEVFLPDDTEKAIEATVIGYNISYDLAVIKINSTGLTAIEFADSDSLAVGQSVVAIGNPGGLEFIGSVSTGVISGLNRSITVDTGATMSLIQTDAAINPGNSGGALVNSEGKLIGVNSVKLVSTEYEGMGFAIPSNKVKEIADKIISKQNEPTPYIGIQISQTYTAAQLEALGYPSGAVVLSVTDGGPAEEAELQRGDIITEFNGQTISNYTDFDSALADCKPGKSATVKFYRSGRFYSTTVNIESNSAQ